MQCKDASGPIVSLLVKLPLWSRLLTRLRSTTINRVLEISPVLSEWPVALARIIITKCFGRLIQQHLSPVCLLLHWALSHLERENTYVRTLVTDFEFAFQHDPPTTSEYEDETTTPHHLCNKQKKKVISVSRCLSLSRIFSRWNGSFSAFHLNNTPPPCSYQG